LEEALEEPLPAMDDPSTAHKLSSSSFW
jgi:hypothetical protein